LVLTESQVNLIKRFTENIALALDEDTAGDAAARRGIEIADEAGLNIRVIQLQYGKDPDECARHSAKLWRQTVKKAIPVYDFYLKSVVKRFGKKGAESKKKISEELIPILARIANEVVKAHYIKKLAGILKVSEEAVIKEVDRWSKKEAVGQTGRIEKEPRFAKAPRGGEKTRRERLEELLLAYVLQGERGREKRLEQIEIDQIKSNPVKKVFKGLKDFVKKGKLEINKFAKKLPEELVETLDRLYLEDLKIDLNNEKKFNQEFEKIKKEQKKLFLKEKLTALVEQIKKAEKRGKETKVRSLRRDFIQISRKLKNLV